MKTALGKGLSALIPEKEKRDEAGVAQIKIDSIQPNEYQPRKSFSDDTLNELVSSIKEKGIIQPVIVRKVEDDRYQLIAGERRWRAAKIAGLSTIPAIIKDVAPAESLELALIENIQREDLNPVETAEAFNRLITDFNLTHEELSKKVGKDRATVTNYLRLLKLPDKVKEAIASGEITMGHAKALLQVDDEEAQIELAGVIIQKGLSVRETEALCRKGITRHPRKKVETSKDPQIVSLEEKLMQSLGTKVRVLHKSNNKGGKIEIEYYSLDDLDRLLDILIR